jgi:hypothetical protein
VVPEDISHRTGGGGKTKALRKTGHVEGLNNSEAGAFLRKDLGLGHRNTYLLPWSRGCKQEGSRLDKGPQPFLIHQIADKECSRSEVPEALRYLGGRTKGKVVITV